LLLLASAGQAQVICANGDVEKPVNALGSAKKRDQWVPDWSKGCEKQGQPLAAGQRRAVFLVVVGVARSARAKANDVAKSR
jgi:hypothetical protein